MVHTKMKIEEQLTILRNFFTCYVARPVRKLPTIVQLRDSKRSCTLLPQYKLPNYAMSLTNTKNFH